MVLFLDPDDCPLNGTAPARLHVAKCAAGARDTIGLRYDGAIGTFKEDDSAALSDELRGILDAVGAGITSTRALREKLGIGQARLFELVGVLKNKHLLTQDRGGIRLTSCYSGQNSSTGAENAVE